MLNLDQVRLLENRVEKAVGRIQGLTTENDHLRSQLGTLQSRVNELEGLVRAFKDDQGRIEEGILNALDRLSAFEDSVFHSEKDESRTEEPVHPDQLYESEPEPVQAASVSMETADSEPEFAADPASEDVIPAENLDINAEWQQPAVSQKSSSDGQMDIF